VVEVGCQAMGALSMTTSRRNSSRGLATANRSDKQRQEARAFLVAPATALAVPIAVEMEHGARSMGSEARTTEHWQREHCAISYQSLRGDGAAYTCTYP